MDNDNSPATEVKEKFISSFTDITSSSIEEARTFLEADEWNLDAAVSNFFSKNEVPVASAEPNINVPNPSDHSRNCSLKFRIKLPGGAASVSDKEVKSSEIVNDRMKGKDDHKDLDESSRTKYRSLKDIMASTPLVEMSYVTIWKNGYSIDNGPLKKLDNPEDAKALEIIEGLDSPRHQYSPNGKNLYYRTIIRRPEEDFSEPQPQAESVSVSKPLQAESDSVSESSEAESNNVSTETPPTSSKSMNTASPSPSPSVDLEIDPTAPTTKIEIRFSDGSAIVSQFNTHHTIRDIRGFIDASRSPDASRDYKLFIAETLPPEPLTDLDQTIEEAGIADKLLIHYQISRK